MKIGAEMSAAMAALDRQVAQAKNVAGQAVIKDKLEKPNAADSLAGGSDATNSADENAMNEMAEASAEAEGAEENLGKNLDVTA